MATRSRHRSIKALSTALLAAYVLGLCAVFLAFTVTLLRRESDAAHQRLQQTSRMLAMEIDDQIGAGGSRLATVAALPGLVYGLRSIREAGGDGPIPPWTTLHYIFFRSPVFTGGVFLLGNDLRVLWTEPPGVDWRGTALAALPVIGDAARRRSLAVSTRLESSLLHDTPHVILAQAIIGPDNETVGVLGGIIDLDATELTSHLAGVPTDAGRFAAVLDQEDHLLVGVGALDLLPGALPDDAGSSALTATTTLGRAPWRIVAGQDRRSALAEIVQMQRLLAAAGIALVLAAIAGGGPFVRRLTHSLQSLTRHAETIEGGDLSRPLRLEARYAEIATLASSFERMRVELLRSHTALTERLRERDDLIRLKEEFLANISHELRTPLHVVVGYTNILLEGAQNADDAQILERIRMQSENLFDLLQNLLVLSDLNTGKIAPEMSDVAVAPLFAHLREMVESRPHEQAVTIAWHAPPDLPLVHTDALRLEQALINLIHNAFKFTPHGSIVISARCDEARQRLVFEVRDTGIGIAETALPHIFDEFRQADGSMSRSYGGLGVGLALVRKLVTLLGGTIDVASRPQRGSTFTLSIPLRPQPAARDDAAEMIA